MTARLTATVLIALTGLAAGCPDTQGRLDRFIEHSEPFRVSAITAECTAPIDLSGDYLIGVGAVINPDKPIQFKGAVTVDLDANTITIAMRALDFTTRVEVGEVATASSPLDAEGGFVLDFGVVDVPADANPILTGVDVEAELVFTGCTATESFSCGAADGTVVVPTTVQLAGSSWAMIRVPAGTDIATVDLISACPE